MKMLTGRRLGLLGLVVAVSVAVAGIAYAAIPDSNGVIHSCYNSDNGALRVFGKSKDFQQCNAGEKALDWSQTGPTGLTGATGPTGPTGATGATGPSDAFAQVGGNFNSMLVPPDFPGIAIKSQSLPAGSYVLNAELAFTGNGSISIVQCAVFLGGTFIAETVRTTVPASGPTTMPIASAFQLAATTTVSITCVATAPGPITQPSTMTAIRVGSLTGVFGTA